MKRKRLSKNEKPKTIMEHVDYDKDLAREEAATKRLSAKLKMIDSYDAEVHPKQVALMVQNGALEREIISALHITKPVFDVWRAKHMEFAAALHVEGTLADQRVQRSIFEMANGYTQPATKIFVHEGEVIKVDHVEHVPKNINAAKFWLANRDASNWGKNPDDDRSKQPLGVININTIQGMTTEQLRNSIALVRSALVPQLTTGLKRLDVVDVEATPVPPDKPRKAKKAA